ncbi:MAG: hypothetical protein KF723_00090 [Rhizobiaceae bacterium]|nr:hypothetical protein [Rhizobiaceae bacterium]
MFTLPGTKRYVNVLLPTYFVPQSTAATIDIGFSPDYAETGEQAAGPQTSVSGHISVAWPAAAGRPFSAGLVLQNGGRT